MKLGDKVKASGRDGEFILVTAEPDGDGDLLLVTPGGGGDWYSYAKADRVTLVGVAEWTAPPIDIPQGIGAIAVGHIGLADMESMFIRAPYTGDSTSKLPWIDCNNRATTVDDGFISGLIGLRILSKGVMLDSDDS